MKVSIKDIKGKEFDAYVIEALEDDQLTCNLVKDNEIQGLLKLEWENDEYVIMKNVEVSPSNYGSKGQYANIAEILISFACYQTFRLNKGGYTGYLAFTSKGSLIEYYQEKYGAELVFRERMIIAPQAALKLIQTHLKLNLRK